MARPHKNGLDYFPFDTKPDMKMNSIIMKYGATGLGCLVGLYQKIYDNGYFVKVDSDFIEDLCLELRIEDEDFLKDFIKFCIKRKLFHSDLYKKNKILTSNGIQKRFNEATRRRKCKHDVDRYFINVYNNLVNDDNNSDNESESTQREIEIEKEIETIYTFETFWKDYDKKVGKPKCENKWKSISEVDRKLIMENVPKYKESQPNKKFRKDPHAYLNQQAWNDELIYGDNKGTPTTDQPEIFVI